MGGQEMFGKAWAGFLGSLAVVLFAILGDGWQPVGDSIAIVSAVGGTVIVWLVPVTTEYPWVKSAAGFVVYAAGAVSVGIADGFVIAQDVPVWIGLALAYFGVKISGAESGNGVYVGVGWRDQAE